MDNSILGFGGAVMARIAIHPGDRQHMLVWRAHPTWEGDPGWRAARALNGTPTTFGAPFMSWREAMDWALEVVAS